MVKYRPEDNESRNDMYDPSFEHDSCGIGFVARQDGKPLRSVVEDAITMLENMEHRGGQGAEPNSGDGAGILIQIPHSFYSRKALECGFELPPKGTYGVGNTFFPKDEVLLKKCQAELSKYIKNFGLTLLGYRLIPVDNSMLGKAALDSEPNHVQFFVAPSKSMDQDALERRLVVLRKYANRTIHQLFPSTYDSFYISSLSARTVIYKGQLTTEQLKQYFLDLQEPKLESALALVHSRFSTNTTPKWKLAQPFRFIAHNGEINTIAGNVNGMSSKTALFRDSLFSEQELELIHPICDPRRSDSSNLDNVVEVLTSSGRSLPHAMMMLVPEAYENDSQMPQFKKDFYEYHAHLMEPWDGPASLSFTDGKIVGAVLDRNGLRPSRYTVTKDGTVIMSSEAGSLPVDPANVIKKGRLEPGKMFVVDMEQGRIITDEELKESICKAKPYGEWLKQGSVAIDDLPYNGEKAISDSTYEERLRFHGYTKEEIERVLFPMFLDGKEAIGSMGADNPLALLSERPQHLAHYFRQRFAQVSNPPIDSIRERSVMSLSAWLGPTHNVLDETPSHCRKIRLDQPILDNTSLQKLRSIDNEHFTSHEIEALFYADNPDTGLENAIKSICKESDFAVKSGANLLIVSDRKVNAERVAIPSLLAVGAIHHYLIQQGVRSNVSIIVESGDTRSTHHAATLFGYGANAVNPYMVFDILRHEMRSGKLGAYDLDDANSFSKSYRTMVEHYIKAMGSGLLKIFAKMGISTLESYQSSQIFEPIGLDGIVVGSCFRGSPSRLGGLGFYELSKEQLDKHKEAFELEGEPLPYGGVYHWRKDGEYHHMNPHSITALQRACREDDYNKFKEYSRVLDGDGRSLRHLLKFKERPSIPIEEVERVELILKRFATGAMSFGSISHEAHSTLAVAMNRIGAKSNSGEGGEDEIRFEKDENGDWQRSAIKQVASGRFGVTINYLTNANEIQIKMAQGAKPGEGGHLPGHKVDDWIGRVRHSTPGVGLISPPPHHDIYSIEDLAQLIYDLKRANPGARVSVKLVSLTGVGTIATGVVKAKADTVLISGMDGGTGASPLSSIQHAGVPWEIGLAEAHQTLVKSRLRDRVLLQADGMMRTGRDLAIATLLGAEEWGVATAALIAEGCIMMRKCHLNTCPVGIATQNPELRKLFTGKPEHVINMFRFMAEELREIMAELGFRTIDEMVGQSHVLKQNLARGHWKTDKLDLNPLIKYYEWQRLPNAETGQPVALTALDEAMIDGWHQWKLTKEPVYAHFHISNTDRAVGTVVAHHIAATFGSKGLPMESLNYHFEGSAGQSFGAFTAKGMVLKVVGESNDYAGKGLSGGTIIIQTPEQATYEAASNVICGNVALYGATSGEMYINGLAGERFCVRNSGARAIVEGIGDHGCEYMTGGEAIILGPTGKNFGAGMSGGIAFVLDEKGDFKQKFNGPEEDIESISSSDQEYLKSRIQDHFAATGSAKAEILLQEWENYVSRFVKVFPSEYKKVLTRKTAEAHG
jgi:glutamate synthase (NADPH/NADH) large chain